MKKIVVGTGILLLCIVTAYFLYIQIKQKTNFGKNSLTGTKFAPTPAIPLSIDYMRKQQYPGSNIIIKQTLPDGSNYSRYIASYLSDGLKIYALLTVPKGEKPVTGWPVIIFNHGYIPPQQYVTTERYIAYIDAFSRNGYIVFKSDYRGHGNSEGKTEYPEFSSAYTVDVLNAIASVKKLKDIGSSSQLLADPNRIGLWGHSMGGSVTFRALIVSPDIKAAEIWAGVVGTFQDLTTYRVVRPDGTRPTINPTNTG